MVLCCHQQAWLWGSRTGSPRGALGPGHDLGEEGFGRRPLPARGAQGCGGCPRGWNGLRALPVLVQVIDVKVVQVKVQISPSRAVPCRASTGSCALSPQGCAGHWLPPTPHCWAFLPAAVPGLGAEPQGSPLPAPAPGKRQLCSPWAGQLLSSLPGNTRAVQGLICFCRKAAGMNRKHRWGVCGFGGVSVRAEAPAWGRTWSCPRTHTRALLHRRLPAPRKSAACAILVQTDRISQQFPPVRDDKGGKKEKKKQYLVTSSDLPGSTTFIKQFCLTAIKHFNIWWFHRVLSHHV